MDLHIRQARSEDTPRLQAIRRAAFAPVFASFRSLLGDDIYELAQRRQDEAQGELLAKLLAGEAGWTLYAAALGDEIVGFVAAQVDPATLMGEIGLNAVDPVAGGQGDRHRDVRVRAGAHAGGRHEGGQRRHRRRPQPRPGPARLSEGRLRRRGPQRLDVPEAVTRPRDTAHAGVSAETPAGPRGVTAMTESPDDRG